MLNGVCAARRAADLRKEPTKGNAPGAADSIFGKRTKLRSPVAVSEAGAIDYDVIQLLPVLCA